MRRVRSSVRMRFNPSGVSSPVSAEDRFCTESVFTFNPRRCQKTEGQANLDFPGPGQQKTRPDTIGTRFANVLKKTLERDRGLHAADDLVLVLIKNLSRVLDVRIPQPGVLDGRG